MAFEVFDDVGFYWFILSILGAILLPWTIGRICAMCFCTDDSNAIKGREAKFDDLGLPISRTRVLFSRTNLVFVALWLVFAWSLFQSSAMSNQKMATFDPYEILHIEKGKHVAIQINTLYIYQRLT